MEQSQKELEKQQSDVLLNKGYKFKVKVFGFEFPLEIKHFTLGTLDYLSAEYGKLYFDKSEFAIDAHNESKVLVGKNAKIVSKILAIAVLNSNWKIPLFKGILSKILYWNIEPKKLVEIVVEMDKMSDLINFIDSIRFLHKAQRTTAPNRIEENQVA